MALTQGELQRLKHEVGINQLTLGAEPYVGITRYFEQIVLPYLQSGPITTSSTVVIGSTSQSVLLALVSSAGISIFDRAIVDVDASQEEATVQSVVGNNITVQLAKPHGAAGAYPVTIEGGESLVRTYLRKCRYVADKIEQFGPRAGLKKADEIEFFGGAHGRASEKSGYTTLVDMQRGFRTELCMLLFGVGNIQQLGGGGSGGGSRIGVY